MKIFGERLKELMSENQVDVKTLATDLGLADSSIIYHWLKTEGGMLISSAIMLADYFECTLEYLLGRTSIYNEMKAGIYPPFGIQLKLVLAKKQVSQYRLLKDKVVLRGNLYVWFNKNGTPNVVSVINLANYLDVTIDYLVGREK